MHAHPNPTTATEPRHTSLSDIPIRSQATVTKLVGPKDVTQRLQEMGLTPDTAVAVLKRAPLGDPLELLVRGYHLAVRKADAACVGVRDIAPLNWTQT